MGLLPGKNSALFALKDVSAIKADTESEEGLRRSVNALNLTALGVGAIIGTGIFVVIGEGIGEAGPAVIVSFLLAAVTCLFSALSYSELAASIPVSGSAYTYAYATLGELVAWIIGWDLILEYGVSVAAVAVGWGTNFNEFLQNAFGVALPDAIALSPEEGGVINVPAVVIVLAVTALLAKGVSESAKVNTIMVGVKLVVLIFFIVVAFTAFNTDNFAPFAPKGTSGILTAAGLIFFAYIGFDAISTGSEESKNPKRDLPLAIVGSLIIATIVYVLVAITAAGALPSDELTASSAPLAQALETGAGIPWAAAVLAFGAVVAITSVILVILYGQTRIMFAMCRDGLAPRSFAKINPRTGTPMRLTWTFGIFIAVLAALVPLSEIIKLVNIGTLFAFILVNIGVIVLRRTRPDMERPFRVPFSPIFPLIGIALCILLTVDLPGTTWLRFVLWLVAGLFIYAFYGYRHSRLRTESNVKTAGGGVQEGTATSGNEGPEDGRSQATGRGDAGTEATGPDDSDPGNRR